MTITNALALPEDCPWEPLLTIRAATLAEAPALSSRVVEAAPSPAGLPDGLEELLWAQMVPAERATDPHYDAWRLYRDTDEYGRLSYRLSARRYNRWTGGYGRTEVTLRPHGDGGLVVTSGEGLWDVLMRISAARATRARAAEAMAD